MSGQPWGRTGRVTLRPWPTENDGDFDLHVDNKYAGDLWRITFGVNEGHWFGRTTHTIPETWEFSPDFADLDAAVAWVLRRAAPDVWRAERPVVYSIARATYPKEVRWWVWLGPGWPKEDHGDHDCIHPIVVRTFADAIYVANFNARALARSRS